MKFFRIDPAKNIRRCANGVTICWDPEERRIRLSASERGWRYMTRRAKKKGLTPEEFGRQILADTFRQAGLAPLEESFAISIDEI